jgi:hypothetical protein
MGGAVAPGALELEHDLAGAIALEPLVGNRRAGDIAAQAFELLALMSATAHGGVQAKAVRVNAARLLAVGRSARDGLQAQSKPAARRTKATWNGTPASVPFFCVASLCAARRLKPDSASLKSTNFSTVDSRRARNCRKSLCSVRRCWSRAGSRRWRFSWRLSFWCDLEEHKRSVAAALFVNAMCALRCRSLAAMMKLTTTQRLACQSKDLCTWYRYCSTYP